MLEPYYVGAYWGARKEAAAACARRAERFFQLLSRGEPSFNQWYRAQRGAGGSPDLLVRTDDVGELETVFLHGRVRTDEGSKLVEELGFGLRVWNLPTRERTRLSIRCGCTTGSVSNSCLVDLPSQGEATERLLRAEALAEVLTRMVMAWEPDWGVVSSGPLQDLTSSENNEEIDVGWVTYLSRRQGTVPPLPAPVRMERVGTLGTLITLTPERLTASNPEHVALTQRIRELLKRAGVLKRM